METLHTRAFMNPHNIFIHHATHTSSQSLNMLDTESSTLSQLYVILGIWVLLTTINREVDVHLTPPQLKLLSSNFKQKVPRILSSFKVI